jgi:hypothetical protein
MMMSALDSVTKRRVFVVAAGDLLRHEIQRVALGDAERRGGAGGRDRDADGDFIGLRLRGHARQHKTCCEHCCGKSGFPHSFLPADMFLGLNRFCGPIQPLL